MTKKLEATEAIATGLSKPLGEWLLQFHGIGAAHAAEGKKVLVETTALVASATNLESLIRGLADLEQAAVRYGIDAHFWSAVRQLSSEASTASNQAPADLRKIEVVTPAERVKLEAARALISRIRAILNRYGQATGTTDQLELLGRGDAVTETPTSIFDALNTLLSQASQRAALLLDAGIVQGILDEATSARDSIQQLIVTSGQRRAQKEAVPGTIVAAKRALESALGMCAARMGAALLNRPDLLEKVLSAMPRRIERRKRGAASSAGSGEGTTAGEAETASGSSASSDAKTGAAASSPATEAPK